jgi:hypothetical protein
VYVLVCFNRKSLSDGINNLHTNFPIERKNFIYRQGLQENICKVKQDCFGTRSLSEFYIIIFLNKLKLVENTKKKQSTKNKMKKIKIKCLWLRVWGPSEIHSHFLGSPGPGPMYRLNPLS